MGTSPHTPTSFGDPKKQKDCIYIQNIGLILYIFQIYKVKKLALFGSFCGGKKNNKKIDKLKNF
ncbi:hypothetical protein EPJ72_09870 [Brachyspira pilosicoli]|uniref:Uncharacterized protein n=1 Tax=Brachyspira pilosicoli TaxID=52584 RepID=A0A5C8EN58_BRAPL|nr:hypothetical protein EPJ72_09870 [Brachyspira pilosicoli]